MFNLHKFRRNVSYSSSDSDFEPETTKKAFEGSKNSGKSKPVVSEFIGYSRSSDSSPESGRNLKLPLSRPKVETDDDSDDDDVNQQATHMKSPKVHKTKSPNSNYDMKASLDKDPVGDSFDLADTSKQVHTTPRTERFDDLTDNSQIIKIYIDHKPPIQNKLTLVLPHGQNRSPSLERPTDSDSNSTAKLGRDSDVDDDLSSNEITDVSPLSTPKNASQSTNLSTNSKTKKIVRLSDTVDMDDLLKSIKHHVKYKDKNIEETTKPQGHSHMAMFDVDNQNRPMFTKKHKENDEILKKILHSKEKKTSFGFEKPVKMTSSALNRLKEQQRIERENKMIFKRILSVKPSKFLNKNEQLKDYYKCFGTTFYTHPNNNSQNKNFKNDSRPASNTSSFMQNQYTGSTINYAQSIMSSKSSVRSYSSNSRLSSAKSTANNSFVDKQPHSSSKPAWENRW